jgi:hypothetical protein
MLLFAMPLLLLSVIMGWWAQKKTVLPAIKVLVGQLMIDSAIISFFILFFLENFSFSFLVGALVYAGITSLRLRTFFDKLEELHSGQ